MPKIMQYDKEYFSNKLVNFTVNNNDSSIGRADKTYYDNSNSNLEATTAQGAIDEIVDTTVKLGSVSDAKKITIPTDINNILECGQYVIQTSKDVASQCANLPVDIAGTLIVTDYTGSDNEFYSPLVTYRVQTYITFNNTGIYTRYIYMDPNISNSISYDEWKSIVFEDVLHEKVNEVSTLALQTRNILVEKAVVVIEDQEYSSLEEFIISTDTRGETDNANGKFVIFTDTTGWGPAGTENMQYRGYVIYQEYCSEDINESVDGNITLYNDDNSYIGFITGTIASGFNVVWSNTKDYVDSRIDELVNGAPEALDTLKEIADAIGENGDIIKSINNLTTHTNNKNNPHGVTATQIGAVPVGDRIPCYSIQGNSVSSIFTNLGFTLDNTFDELYQLIRQNNNQFENNFLIINNSNVSNFNKTLPVQEGGIIECIGIKSSNNRCVFKFYNFRNNDIYVNSALDGTLNGWVKLADITDTELKQVNLSTNISNAFKSSIKGDTVRGGFLSTFRDNTGVNEGMVKYGAGLAWGIEDTHAYLNIGHDAKKAYIGGGNADKINWIRSIAFEEDSIPKTGGSVTGDLNFVNMKGIQWQESGYGDKFKIVPNFSGADDQNKLLIQSAAGAANTDPTLNTVISIAGKTGNTEFAGNITAPKFIGDWDSNKYFIADTTNGKQFASAEEYVKYVDEITNHGNKTRSACIRFKDTTNWTGTGGDWFWSLVFYQDSINNGAYNSTFSVILGTTTSQKTYRGKIILPKTGTTPESVEFVEILCSDRIAPTVSAQTHSDYPNKQDLLVTKNFINWWNGAYNSNNGSNLAYCNKGAFGDMATKSSSDYATKSELNTVKSNFQAGVDTIYNACVSVGSTPSAKTPAGIQSALNTLRTGYGNWYGIMRFINEVGFGTDLVSLVNYTPVSGCIMIMKKNETYVLEVNSTVVMSKSGNHGSTGDTNYPHVAHIGVPIAQNKYTWNNEYSGYGFSYTTGQIINVKFIAYTNANDRYHITAVNKGIDIFTVCNKRSDTGAWVSKYIVVIVI